MNTAPHTPWYWQPVVALWRATTWLEKRIGFVRCLLFGAGLMLLGIVFCLTFVGLLVGLPTLLVGLFLFVRGLI